MAIRAILDLILLIAIAVNIVLLVKINKQVKTIDAANENMKKEAVRIAKEEVKKAFKEYYG